METAYGPFVAVLARELRAKGLAVDDEDTSAEGKRRLLAAAVERFGLSCLEEVGRPVARLGGHPFISALLAADSADTLLRRWRRLEVLAHSENRVRVVERADRAVRLARETRKASAPSLAEDTLILGVIAGLLEAVGAETVRVSNDGEDASTGARHWSLTWSRWRPPEAPAAIEPWGVSSDFARSAFTLLLDDPGSSLASVARALHVSPRSLQRRLGEAGTRYQSLVRMARVALAGGTLARSHAAQPSLTSVAHACGFADSAHLSREFRALVGIQPQRFARALDDSRPIGA